MTRHRGMTLPGSVSMVLPERHDVQDDPSVGRTLLARLRDGDEQAFEEIFRTWYAPLVRFATRIIGDAARAEEVVQDVALELWRRRASLDASATPQAWLFHSVRNRALNVLRHDATVARAAPGLTAAHGLHMADAPIDADRALAEADLCRAIDAAVERLPPRCREVFVLSRREGLKQQEIATRLGIGLKAVEAQMTRALRHLRSELAPWLAVER